MALSSSKSSLHHLLLIPLASRALLLPLCQLRVLATRVHLRSRWIPHHRLFPLGGDFWDYSNHLRRYGVFSLSWPFSRCPLPSGLILMSRKLSVTVQMPPHLCRVRHGRFRTRLRAESAHDLIRA
ncbi:hypothetical protein DFH06DRAFT_1213815 [Mycena polygramma]|nr:hypothetical protein DFH06DRAFT_1213815 [Mycena polygramma]